MRFKEQETSTIYLEPNYIHTRNIHEMKMGWYSKINLKYELSHTHHQTKWNETKRSIQTEDKNGLQ